MPGRSEQYFLSQITTLVGIPSGILATSYFRSVAQKPAAEQDTSLFVDTAIARGYFIALARDRLIVVKTQAPTSSKPMLDNQGVLVIPLSKIRRIAFKPDLLLIDSEIETMALELKWTNKHFPSQKRLIDELAAGFSVSHEVASIRASQRRKRWLKVALVLAAIAAAIVGAVYQYRP